MSNRKKSFFIIVFMILMYLILAGTNGGEFWPFSIYPMFSQAGKPWTKALVRDVTKSDNTVPFKTVMQLEQLPGQPLALNDIGVNQNDLSNFIRKTDHWSRHDIHELRSLFASQLISHKIIIYKVKGELVDKRVVVHFTPMVFLDSDTTIFSPAQVLH